MSMAILNWGAAQFVTICPGRVRQAKHSTEGSGKLFPRVSGEKWGRRSTALNDFLIVDYVVLPVGPLVCDGFPSIYYNCSMNDYRQWTK